MLTVARGKPKLSADMIATPYRYYGELIQYYSYYWVSPYTVRVWVYRIIEADGTLHPGTKKALILKKYSIYPSRLSWIGTYPTLSRTYGFLHDSYFNYCSTIDKALFFSPSILLFGVCTPLPLNQVVLFVFFVLVILGVVDVSTIAYMAGTKSPVKQALIKAMEPVFELHRGVLGKTLSPQQVAKEMNKFRANGMYSFNKSKLLMITDDNKSFYDLVVEHAAVKKILKTEEGRTKFGQTIWKNALDVAYGIKTKAHSRGKRTIGEMSASATNSCKKKAAQHRSNTGEGLKSLFPNNFDNLMKAFEACRSGDENTIVPGMYNCFNDLAGDQAAELIAIQVAYETLELLVE